MVFFSFEYLHSHQCQCRDKK